MTLSQKSKNVGKFLGFYGEFHQNFQIQDKNFQVNLKLNQIVPGFLLGIVF